MRAVATLAPSFLHGASAAMEVGASATMPVALAP